jgi:hypothetical protein
MFRGGHVSAYGTGIASGLADGGMPDKRGLVTGPGGYAGWEDYASGYGETGNMILGSDLMNFVQKNPKYGSLDFANTLNPKKYYNKPSGTYEIGRSGPTIENSPEFLKLYQNFMDPETMLINPDEVDIETGEITGSVSGDAISGSEGDISTTSVEDSAAVAEEEPGKIKDIPGIDDDDPTAVGDSDLASMVSKYEDLLGAKKARGRDISDMLLSAGSKLLEEGATVKSGFSEFLGEEAKKGPGRGEKIKQAATMLAIKGEQAKDAAKASMEAAIALKLVGITDKNKERAFTTRLADYTKKFMADPYNEFKQKNASSFASALVMAEDLSKGGQAVGIVEYAADGNSKAEEGIIYIDPMAIIKGTPFYFNGTYYKTHKEALEAQQGG